MKKIRELPSFDRPREKLMAQGAEALSDTELLAILLGSGRRGADVFKLARTVLHHLELAGEKPEAGGLTAIAGVGTAKACQIMAALEFSRRRLARRSIVIRQARDIVPLLTHISTKKQEYFVCLSLNGANEVVGNRVVTIGLVNSTQIHPREVFADAIFDRAASVILAHNHPSGALQPSRDDLAITRQLQEAGRILGIPVLDHLIISQRGYFSFQEEGLLEVRGEG